MTPEQFKEYRQSLEYADELAKIATAQLSMQLEYVKNHFLRTVENEENEIAQAQAAGKQGVYFDRRKERFEDLSLLCEEVFTLLQSYQLQNINLKGQLMNEVLRRKAAEKLLETVFIDLKDMNEQLIFPNS